MGDFDTVLKTFDLERGHFSSSTNSFFPHSAVVYQIPSIFLIDLDSTNFTKYIIGSILNLKSRFYDERNATSTTIHILKTLAIYYYLYLILMIMFHCCIRGRTWYG